MMRCPNCGDTLALQMQGPSACLVYCPNCGVCTQSIYPTKEQAWLVGAADLARYLELRKRQEAKRVKPVKAATLGAMPKQEDCQVLAMGNGGLIVADRRLCGPCQYLGFDTRRDGSSKLVCQRFGAGLMEEYAGRPKRCLDCMVVLPLPIKALLPPEPAPLPRREVRTVPRSVVDMVSHETTGSAVTVAPIRIDLDPEEPEDNDQD
jgi:hypothetical protein